ncbi:unnamed protein product, partial [Staurois parvus]
VSLGHSRSPINGKSRRCWLSHGTCTQIIRALRALMICVAPAVPPVSVHQCQLSVLIHATCQCPSVPHQCHISVPINATSMPHISAHLSCLSESPISASQCHLSVLPISATISAAYQCQSVSVPVSAAYRCTSVLPSSAT